MKTKVKHIAIFTSSFLVISIVLCLSVHGADNKTTISDAEYSRAWVQVQNTMSKHMYYHAAAMHFEEMEDIWVKEDGPYAKTATFSNPMGVWEGMKLLKEFYAAATVESNKQNLAEISKVYPEIENVPENYTMGIWIAHTQTTPIIEIAGDGKTAKGIWYSPGAGLSSSIVDGKLVANGTWFWEKYAVDFAKEDGEWKIWHFQTYYDIVQPLGGDWTKVNTQQEADRELGEANEEEQEAYGLPDATRPNSDPYQSWSPTTVPRIKPRFPEPYYTFSETFSY